MATRKVYQSLQQIKKSNFPNVSDAPKDTTATGALPYPTQSTSTISIHWPCRLGKSACRL